MSRFRRAWSCATGIALALIAGGCFPSGDSPLDEQKEPHFITGKNLATQMDYQGAIDSFEKALEINPRSASAHFELAWLYENKAQTPDPAAAIYHYDRFLKLSPKSDKADLVRAHMNSCRLELAKTASTFTSWPASMQHDMENLMLENKNLKAQLAQFQAAANHTPAPSAAPAPQPQTQPVSRPVLEPQPIESVTPSAAPARQLVLASRSTASAGVRTHIIKSHENPSIIAKEYGITIAALMAANPQVQPTHLQVGHSLNIPTP
jgi:tetratricopeptide (TPR) repeat protein